jgi:hypothetical protein
LNCFGGGKFLFSSKRTSLALSAMIRPPLKKFSQQRPKDEWILFKPWALGKSWRTLFGAPVSNDFQVCS